MMKTISFTNRERIEIGTDHIEYMTYLQKKLPGANYTNPDALKPGTPAQNKHPAGGVAKGRYLTHKAEQK